MHNKLKIIKPSRNLTWAGAGLGAGAGAGAGTGAGGVPETFGAEHFGGDPPNM